MELVVFSEHIKSLTTKKQNNGLAAKSNREMMSTTQTSDNAKELNNLYHAVTSVNERLSRLSLND